MRNYIILNGNDSRDVVGLLIQELAPISKPAIRNTIEEIDGRDGDIVTKLGYSAYDKEITVGLYGNYDVNDVIKYFDSEGTVVFSNEPEKYYKYQILDQIDYERLIRFRTATVRMHCQPFKYPTNEPEIEINATEVTGSGSNFTLDNTENEANFTEIKLNGNTDQTTYSGKNLITLDAVPDGASSGITKTFTGSEILLNGTTTGGGSIASSVATGITLPAGTYTFTLTILGGSATFPSGTTALYIRNGSNGEIIAWNLNTRPYVTQHRTLTADTPIKFELYTNASGQVFNNYRLGFQIEAGSSATSYEPYVGGVASPNPNYPQDVRVVTGEQTVKITGKNLFNIQGYYDGIADDKTASTVALNDGNIVWTNTTNDSYFPSIWANSGFPNHKNDAIKVDPNTTYTLSLALSANIGNGRLYVYEGDANYNGINNDHDTFLTNRQSVTLTFTTSANTKYIIVRMARWESTSHAVTVSNIQLEKGSTATDFEPYQEQCYTIDLDTLELCKIGDYQDYIYKSGGNWYLHKEVRHVSLNVSDMNNQENYAGWKGIPNVKADLGVNLNTGLDQVTTVVTNFISTAHALRVDTVVEGTLFLPTYMYPNLTQTQWQTQYPDLVCEIYYGILNQPTDTPITGTLLDDLNAFSQATTYTGTTVVVVTSDTTNNAQLTMFVKTLATEDYELTVTNTGNIYSKPKLTIYGIGVVGLYLDGNQIFRINFGDTTDHITIDTAEMEAYTDNLNTLRNRDVTGDYDNCRFAIGDNVLSFSGTIQGIVVENYIRWI